MWDVSWPAQIGQGLHEIGQQQATSAKACTKNRGVCASGKRHRPTARNINQGLHGSAVACAHRLGDIIRGLRASANDRRHRRRAARINHGVCASTGRHRLGDVAQRYVASAKACTHRTSHVRIWQTTSATGLQQQPRPARISRGACTLAGRHRLWLARIGQRLATSSKAWTHQPWCVRIWQTTTANGMQHRPGPSCISRGVCASSGRHRLWPACISQRQGTSAKAYTHQPWRVRIVWATSLLSARIGKATSAQRQATSAKACAHLTWHGRIRHATSANGKQHRPRPARICRGVCASAGRHWRRLTAGSIS